MVTRWHSRYREPMRRNLTGVVWKVCMYICVSMFVLVMEERNLSLNVMALTQRRSLIMNTVLGNTLHQSS